MVVTILGNTNTLPEKYRIAQYADPPYQLQPLDGTGIADAGTAGAGAGRASAGTCECEAVTGVVR